MAQGAGLVWFRSYSALKLWQPAVRDNFVDIRPALLQSKPFAFPESNLLRFPAMAVKCHGLLKNNHCSKRNPQKTKKTTKNPKHQNQK